MTKTEILNFIALFDQLPEDEKTYGDGVIRDYLRVWAVQQDNSNSPLQFSDFLLAHTGPRNFNAYLSSPENSQFMSLFAQWQEDCVVFVSMRVPAARWQPENSIDSSFQPRSPSQ